MRFRRKRVKNGLAGARREREEAEKRLAHAQEHVITPLRELRERNHVSEMIEAAIQRRVQGGRQ